MSELSATKDDEILLVYLLPWMQLFKVKGLIHTGLVLS